jgi:release factor glutamine methyltransferase
VTEELSIAAVQQAGRCRFLDLELLVGPGVLVPRAETELLALTAIELLQDSADRPLLLVDLCCGAGNLACAIAAHLPSARVWACDLLPAAVELTRLNVDQLGLAGRVTVLQGDLLAPLAGLGLEGLVDAMVCNPPYISTSRLAGDRGALLEHEPREAFDGGPYGFSIHQRVTREAGPFLKAGAPLLMELGLGQDRQVAMLVKRSGAWEEPAFRPDGTAPARVIVCRRKRS